MTASPPFWTCVSSLIDVRCGALFPSLMLVVCRGILGLGLQGIVMVNKCKGSQGLDHAGDDPGNDDGVLVFADCSHSGEDEDIHDEGPGGLPAHGRLLELVPAYAVLPVCHCQRHCWMYPCRRSRLFVLVQS